MFEKSPKSYTDLLGKTNRIVEGTTIKGDMFSGADFRLDGELIGNFTCSGKIVIGPAGSVKGDIVCKNADIEGSFNGKIHVSELLSVKSKADIRGEVICAKLSVEPGAGFTASCIMKDNQKHCLHMKSNNDPKKKRSNKWLALINIPIQMGIIIFAFAWGGKWLDENYPNNHNVYVKVLTLIGVALAFYNINRQLKDINNADK